MPSSASTPDIRELKVVLISPYDLGRQPFALAEPAAWLREAGFAVHCLDLSQQRLEPSTLAGAEMVAIHVGMHTATRIAMEAVSRILELAPTAHVCLFGLYAPMNAGLFRKLGAGTILGGECEPALLDLAQRLRHGETPAQMPDRMVHREKVAFLLPDRSGLPPLSRYAHLVMPDGTKRTAGFAEASRGCKHLCRHCPVVPVYEGKFRVVPVDVVLADIDQQVAAGARHISFGDPDFLNGSTHALRIVQGLAERHPGLTFDATIKIQHLIRHENLLPILKRAGCLFITSAVESVDDRILEYLDKNHTRTDFERATALCREAGIALAPTFVAFTPWITLNGYLEWLQSLVDLRLVAAVPPIQLAIRLLVPAGSRLLELPEFRALVGEFDARLLGYPWRHPDPRVDALQAEIQGWVAEAESQGLPRSAIFDRIWRLAHEAADRKAPALEAGQYGEPIPHLSEPWYCCAEPTSQQLQSF